MKISVDQIKALPRPLRYREAAQAFAARLREGEHAGSDDFRFPAGLEADLQCYRAGLDVVFEGALAGEADGTCSRCLESYRFAFAVPLRVVVAPRAAAGDGEGDDDLGLGFYEGEDVDVTALVVEHAILALPTRPLCDEGCRGLCPHCGANMNVRPCACDAARPATAARAVLAGAKVLDGSGGR